jgi:hypothetical protein
MSAAHLALRLSPIIQRWKSVVGDKGDSGWRWLQQDAPLSHLLSIVASVCRSLEKERDQSGSCEPLREKGEGSQHEEQGEAPGYSNLPLNPVGTATSLGT